MNEPFEKVANEYLEHVTRLEIIDYTPCKHCKGSGRLLNLQSSSTDTSVECGACGGSGIAGRNVIFFDPSKQIELSLQDEERTLKIFINERGE
jgi:hypothetical protein